MNTNNESPLQDKIMSAIRSGDAQMRPRWHFVLKSTLYALGAAILIPFLLYVTSLIIFFLRESGVWFAPVFGMRGWASLFHSLPWMLLGLIALFLVVLEVLARHYAFVYKRPLIMSIVGVLAVVFVGGFLVERTMIHDRMRDFAHGNRLPPPLQGIYGRPGHFLPRGDVYRGTIAELKNDGFVIVNAEDTSTTSVVITPETRLPYGSGFKVGDMVMIMGDSPHPDIIFAFGIRTVDDSVPY